MSGASPPSSRRGTSSETAPPRRARRPIIEEVDAAPSRIVTRTRQALGPAPSRAQARQGLERLDRDGYAGAFLLEGVGSARGIGLGHAVVLARDLDLEPLVEDLVWDPETEIGRIRAASREEAAELRRLSERLEPSLAASERGVLEAHAMLLESQSFTRAIEERIAHGSWAAGAVRAATSEYEGRFEQMQDEYLRARAADVRELGRRLVERLRPAGRTVHRYPERAVLVATEIGIADLLEAPLDRLAGLVSVRGTSASHVASLARALAIPAVFGVPPVALDHLDGREVIVDGDAGRICVHPDDSLRDRYRVLVEERARVDRELTALVGLPTETRDGRRLRLFANSAPLTDLTAALAAGAEGMGLYRSELHFMLRDRFPTEDEQHATYLQVLSSMAPRPVVLRTLDVGGDKFLPYFPIEEPNPFLGWRGIRITLDQPDIFKTQLRAMLRAGARSPNLSILFPMISGVDELEQALELLRQARDELREDHLPETLPPVGVMVEVPSAVHEIEKLASRVDFVSIGTNDLTQYLLAVDRNNARVARLYDPLHPAVLAAIARVVEGAHAVGKPVTVCGEMAADPLAAVPLVGMGLDALSVNPGSLLRIKWVVRTIDFGEAAALARELPREPSAARVRERLTSYLRDCGLAALVPTRA